MQLIKGLLARMHSIKGSQTMELCPMQKLRKDDKTLKISKLPSNNKDCITI